MSRWFPENEADETPPMGLMLQPAPEPQNVTSSAVIDKLITAFAKASLTIENPAKSAENSHFGNRYADLAAGLTAVRKPLAEQGLALIQTTKMTAQGFMLYSRLVHESGQWIESEFPLGKSILAPQQMGSMLTYARRYNAFPLVGIAGENDDDDGNAASHPAPQPPLQQRGRAGKPAKAPKDRPAGLSPEESAAKLKEFLGSLGGLAADDLSGIETWGKKTKPSQAGLVPADFEAISAEYKARRAKAIQAQQPQDAA